MSPVEENRAPGGSAARRLGPISAVVCNYNGEDYLAGCIESLQASEEGLDEIVVVDNASEDGSVELIRRRFPEVKLLRLFANGGPCVARNAGMRAARNRWVLAVDNDAVLAPDVLGGLRAALETHPDGVAAQPRSVFANEPDRVHYDGGRFHYVGLYSLRNFCKPRAEARGEGVVAVDGLIAIAVLLDRDAVLACGGYDESFFILFEDYDLALRLRIAGHACYSVEDRVVLHRGGTPGISFRKGAAYPRIRAYYHSRNRWLLLVKNHAWRTLVVSLPGIVLYELVWSLFTLLKGHLGAHLSGKLGFLRAARATLRERRRVQASRRVPDGALLVGGPLTFSPQLVRSRWARLASRLLSGALRGWWVLARPLVAHRTAPPPEDARISVRAGVEPR